jgi:hypothetical protein
MLVPNSTTCLIAWVPAVSATPPRTASPSALAGTSDLGVIAIAEPRG